MKYVVYMIQCIGNTKEISYKINFINRPPYRKHLLCIANQLNKQLSDDTWYTKAEVDGKIDCLKEVYVNFTDFVDHKASTECGWDDDKGTIIWTPKQWDTLER